nr:hypothetical protein [Tanacetum cinerariifolium]
MQDSVVAADGFTHEAEAIRSWLGSGFLCDEGEELDANLVKVDSISEELNIVPSYDTNAHDALINEVFYVTDNESVNDQDELMHHETTSVLAEVEALIVAEEVATMMVGSLILKCLYFGVFKCDIYRESNRFQVVFV